MIHIEVRKLIISARQRGLSIAEIKRAYGFGETAIYRLLKLERETGCIEPKLQTRGRKPKLDAAGLECLHNLIQSKPDITLKELIEEHGIPLSESRLSRVVREKLGYTYKKRWYTRPNESARM